MSSTIKEICYVSTVSTQVHNIANYPALTFGGAIRANDDDELDNLYRQGGSCTRTAIAAVRSCKLEKTADAWLERGKCNNITDAAKRDRCEATAIVDIEG